MNHSVKAKLIINFQGTISPLDVADILNALDSAAYEQQKNMLRNVFYFFEDELYNSQDISLNVIRDASLQKLYKRKKEIVQITGFFNAESLLEIFFSVTDIASYVVKDVVKESIPKSIKGESELDKDLQHNFKEALNPIGTISKFIRMIFHSEEKLDIKINNIEEMRVFNITNSKNKDNSEMVLIPAGHFLYGSREDDEEAESEEKPQQSIFLPNYYIDKYPVTNEQYCRFLNQNSPNIEKLTEWVSIVGYDVERTRIFSKDNIFTVKEGYERHPVIMVSWSGAQAYSQWAGKRLPTEVEWEKAARGVDGSKYPWGNKLEKNRCNYGEKYKNTTEVTRFEAGKSPYGCFDMAGNVWEWCADWYSFEYRVIRGGWWGGGSGLFQNNLRCANRSGTYPFTQSNNIGFRCAR